MKVLVRYSVDCSMILEAENVEEAVRQAEDIPYEEWEHDHGPVDGERCSESDTVHLSLPRGGSECGSNGSLNADITCVTCQECLTILRAPRRRP